MYIKYTRKISGGLRGEAYFFIFSLFCHFTRHLLGGAHHYTLLLQHFCRVFNLKIHSGAYKQNTYIRVYKIMRTWFCVARMRGLNSDGAKKMTKGWGGGVP